MKLSRKSRFWIGGILLAVGLISIAVFVYNGPESVPPAVPLPIPNGYDDFIVAQKLLVNSENDPWRGDKDLTLTRAQEFVATNAPALARLRTGLAKKWKVPLQYNTNWFLQHMSNDMVTAKRFGQRFSLEGYVAEQNGRFGDAADSYASGIHFGAASAHGGLLIDLLVGVAVENLQFGPLEGVAEKLDVAQCKHALSELQAAATNYESFSTILERDTRWSRYSEREYGSFRVLLRHVGEMIAAKSLHPEAAALARAKQKYDTSLTRLRRLQVLLARRAFELEHHAPAKSWSDLVPVYLSVVPTNSETGQPLSHEFE